MNLNDMKIIKVLRKYIGNLTILYQFEIWYAETKYNSQLRKEILNYYKHSDMKEKYKNELEYIKKSGKVSFFQYNCKDISKTISVLYDESSRLHYVEFQNKRLYFPRKYKIREIQLTYQRLLEEQSRRSPHRYIDKINQLKENTIFLDVGAAEGMIALSLIEKCKLCYLIECEEIWAEPLKMTFMPWKDKVVFVKKYADSFESESTITLDKICVDYVDENIFIKMDIEGAETRALLGSLETLKRNNVAVAICTYHNNEDEKKVQNFFAEEHFDYEFSEGYVLWDYSKRLTPPYFRKCVLRGKNDRGNRCVDNNC